MALNVNDYYASSGSGNYYKAADIAQPLKLTIKVADEAEFGKEGEASKKKIALSFVESDKTLVLNKSNAVSLASIFGNTDAMAWAGKKITLFKTKVKFQGNYVDSIQVAPA